MPNDNLDYAALRRRVEAEVQRERQRGQKALFLVNAGIFILFLLLAWLLIPNTSTNFYASDDTFGMMIMLSVGWATGLFMHGLSAFAIGSPDWMKRHRRRIMAREIEYARLGLDDDELLDDVPLEKAKRGELRLSDEGEVLDIVDEYASADQHRQQRG